MNTVPKITSILYCTDLSGNTRPVFRHALDQARLHNASIIMLHVVEPLTDTAKSVISAYMPESAIEAAQKDGLHSVIDKMKQRLHKFYTDECSGQGIESLPVKEVIVIAGKPSEQILTAAREYQADMIVLGQSVKNIFGSIVMGSTARRVARLAKVPVLIVPNNL